MTTEIPESPAIRAHLAHEAEWASLTDEQRAVIKRNRAVLGSLDDCQALNRSEWDG